MTASGLTLSTLTVRFGDTVAVDHVDLELSPGRVLAVLGPSGCGKSTLLRAVAGLERPTAGRVLLTDGSGTPQDVTDLPVHRRGVSLMFQDGQLFAHLSVGDNVGYPLALRQTPRASRRERVTELLRLVGLEGYQDRRPGSLSGGEQQRVALARALAAEPRLLLLDEPLSALDRALRDRLALDLRGILTRTGTTAVLVTHDHDEAFTVADDVAVMFEGAVVQRGPSAQVWAQPRDERVARFLGYRTVLSADAARRLAALLGDDLAEPLPAGGLVALRPSAVRVLSEAAPDPADRSARDRLTGTVASLARGSDSVRVQVDVDGVGPVTALASPLHPLESGDRVDLRLDPAGVAVLPGPPAQRVVEPPAGGTGEAQ